MNKNSYQKTVQPPVYKQQYDPEEVWAFQQPWHTTLCGCKPASRCCFSCFCCCCMGCKVAKAEGEPMICGCCPCCFPYLRTKIRVARRIEGGCCSDTCGAIFCFPCSLTQVANELQHQSLWPDSEPKTSKPPPRSDRNNRPRD